MKFHKLIRDKIPELIVSKGGKPVTHIADDAEYWQKLKLKLLEEVAEFNKDEQPDELADILEVLEAIIAFKNFDQAEIQKIKARKAEERGKFEKRIILEES